MDNLEKRIRKEIKNAHHPILLPTVRKFDEIFSESNPVQIGESIRPGCAHMWKVNELLPHGKVSEGTGIATLSSYCAVYCSSKNYNNLYIKLNEDIINIISQNMLLMDGYTINFQINVRDDNKTALISAHYNMICGSRWFAIIDASTIPF